MGDSVIALDFMEVVDVVSIACIFLKNVLSILKNFTPLSKN